MPQTIQGWTRGLHQTLGPWPRWLAGQYPLCGRSRLTFGKTKDKATHEKQTGKSNTDNLGCQCCPNDFTGSGVFRHNQENSAVLVVPH
jgi:hypothetical protein